ncbi:MAG: NIPSNAP family protein [Mesorhizobium sp.]|nr:MAG: NIPSNAP family protein [Mesorhizobium sp.]
MTITCFIRYEIDPFGKAAFEEYARNWGEAIPRCGADLIGYFAPHEGSATTAYAAYNIASLAAYEAYRIRLAADPVGRANYEFARRERFILKEDRTFLKLASGPHAPKHDAQKLQTFQTEIMPEGMVKL